jgi:hypothetical protein
LDLNEGCDAFVAAILADDPSARLIVAAPAAAPPFGRVRGNVGQGLPPLGVKARSSLSPSGMIQHGLNGRGHTLWGARVRKFTLPGSSVSSHSAFTVRFISRDPQMVIDNLIEPQARGLGRAVERYQSLKALTEQRVPQLGPTSASSVR